MAVFHVSQGIGGVANGMISTHLPAPPMGTLGRIPASGLQPHIATTPMPSVDHYKGSGHPRISEGIVSELKQCRNYNRTQGKN